MAVTKTIEVDGKEVQFRASAPFLAFTEISSTGTFTRI